MPEMYGFDKMKELLYPFNIARTPKGTYEKRAEKLYGKRAYLVYSIEPIPIGFPEHRIIDLARLLEEYIDEDTPIGTPFVINMNKLIKYLNAQ